MHVNPNMLHSTMQHAASVAGLHRPGGAPPRAPPPRKKPTTSLTHTKKVLSRGASSHEAEQAKGASAAAAAAAALPLPLVFCTSPHAGSEPAILLCAPSRSDAAGGGQRHAD